MANMYFVSWEITLANGNKRTFTRSYRNENEGRIMYRLKDGPKVSSIRLYCINPGERTVTTLAEKSR